MGTTSTLSGSANIATGDVARDLACEARAGLLRICEKDQSDSAGDKYRKKEKEKLSADTCAHIM